MVNPLNKVVSNGKNTPSKNTPASKVVDTIYAIKNLEHNKDEKYYNYFLCNLEEVNFDTVMQLYLSYIKENKNIESKWRFLLDNLLNFDWDLAVIKYSKPENLEENIYILKIAWITDGKRLAKILLSLSYLLIKGKLSYDLNIKNYDNPTNYNISWSEILEFMRKIWKEKLDWINPYIKQKIEWPFNLINLDLSKTKVVDWIPYQIKSKSNTEIDWIQEKGKKIIIWKQYFYSVNNKEDNLPLQLAVNRLFAPFLWMTKLIKLKNWKEEVIVSIDVNDKNATNILWYEESTPETIKDLLRIIYQFIALDWDRKIEHNLENGIIFDFDFIMGDIFYFSSDNINFKNLGKFKQKSSEIIYAFKVYLLKFSKEEINKLWKKTQENRKIYNFWKTIHTRALQLNMLNIIIWMKIEDIEVIKTWKEIDEMVKKLSDSRT